MKITAESLGKRFSREWVFRNFNYSFQEGVYAITGPNGSGKSTLLQILWGQLPASSGKVQYFKEQQELAAEDVYRDLAIATPYMDLVEEFTVREAIRFHFSFKSIRGAFSQEDLLNALELSHLQNKLTGQLSSGMKQRLKLGLAFYSDVSLVFLDEPTTNLDKKSVEWYWKNLTPLVGKCTIFVASNLENEFPEGAKKINLTDYK